MVFDGIGWRGPPFIASVMIAPRPAAINGALQEERHWRHRPARAIDSVRSRCGGLLKH
jgi:hypothetical protein